VASKPRLTPPAGDEPFTRLVDHRPVAVPAPLHDDNVRAPPAPQGEGPRVRRREDWVELPPPYEGFKFRLWVTAPTRVWQALGQGDEVAVPALQSLILAHNGWRDEEGKAFPPADDAAFWAEIPTELAALTLRAAQMEFGRLGEALGTSRRP
jgi:hypothetical protein